MRREIEEEVVAAKKQRIDDTKKEEDEFTSKEDLYQQVLDRVNKGKTVERQEELKKQRDAKTRIDVKKLRLKKKLWEEEEQKKTDEEKAKAEAAPKKSSQEPKYGPWDPQWQIDKDKADKEKAVEYLHAPLPFNQHIYDRVVKNHMMEDDLFLEDADWTARKEYLTSQGLLVGTSTGSFGYNAPDVFVPDWEKVPRSPEEGQTWWDAIGRSLSHQFLRDDTPMEKQYVRDFTKMNATNRRLAKKYFVESWNRAKVRGMTTEDLIAKGINPYEIMKSFEEPKGKPKEDTEVRLA
jgi:HD-GYP domain-containing protein (c-di-GMP phosphodiesterase class II)